VPIANLSDTALLTAYARAIEAERPDALFKDPYSRRLAGIEGEALANESGAAATIAGAVASRTAVFDELVMKKVRQEGADLIVNLAAGLDTRPWRLDLPADLIWIDADLPDLLAYKTQRMHGLRPRCVYHALDTDLADTSALDRLLARCAIAKKGLVISEGLLVYWTTAQVGALANRLHRETSLAWWVTDLAGPRALAMMERSWGRLLQGSRFQFAPPDSATFFGELGWRETEFRSSQEEARRLGRAPNQPLLGRIVTALASARLREEIRRLSGCAVLARTQRVSAT
jgi:methyltransferase (TIGR00027 family)